MESVILVKTVPGRYGYFNQNHKKSRDGVSTESRDCHVLE